MERWSFTQRRKDSESRKALYTELPPFLNEPINETSNLSAPRLRRRKVCLLPHPHQRRVYSDINLYTHGIFTIQVIEPGISIKP